MGNLAKWWENRSPVEQWAIAIAGVTVAVGVAAAVAAEGAIIVAGATVIAVGKPALELARRTT